MEKQKTEYSLFEEKLNVYSHGIGVVISFIGLILLALKSLNHNSYLDRFSFVLFGLSLITLYFASTIYHSENDPVKRKKKKIFDHCAIYVLIAGTYTPYALVALKDNLGWIIFGVVWGFALVGIILKLFFTGRFKLVSTSMYVLMGWLIVFFIKPLKVVLPEEGIQFLMAGGISYTVGAVIYSIKPIKLNHAIFHIFVLVGSVCHFLSIYLYL